MTFDDAVTAIRLLADRIEPHHPLLGRELDKFGTAADYNRELHFKQARRERKQDISGQLIDGP